MTQQLIELLAEELANNSDLITFHTNDLYFELFHNGSDELEWNMSEDFGNMITDGGVFTECNELEAIQQLIDKN